MPIIAVSLMKNFGLMNISLFIHRTDFKMEEIKRLKI